MVITTLDAPTRTGAAGYWELARRNLRHARAWCRADRRKALMYMRLAAYWRKRALRVS